MNELVAFEGLDGSGKSTQIQLLEKHLRKSKIACRTLHFPRSGEGVYGDLIARYLRGELGPLEAVNPYLVSLLYAGDRNDAKTTIQNWLEEKSFVVIDRYLYSNIAFQCAKVEKDSEKKELEDWILNFEYYYNEIPRPNLSIYLHVPFSFVRGQLKNSRNAGGRAYLCGKRDIHEASMDLQKNVEKEYLRLVKKYDDFELINCIDQGKGAIYSPERIHLEILSLIEKRCREPANSQG